MEEEKFDVTDRISQLPEPILQHILSYLVVKDAIRTSVLSKNWKNACATLQFLNFGDHGFFPGFTFNDDQEIFFQKVLELLDVVDRIIATRQQNNVDIQKFCLHLPRYNYQLLDLKPYIDKFVTLLTKGNIEELVLKVGDYHGNPYYTLPEAVYAAESLQKFHLRGFKLESPSAGVMMKINSLQELYLSRIHVDNELLQLLIMGCPELQILDIDYLYGLDHLRILGSSKLKRIRLSNCHRKLNKIEIQTPTLEHLYHHGTGMLYVVNVAACENLKQLRLYGLIINDEWLADLFRNLPFLEKLSLIECWGLKNVRISSDRLKELSLFQCRSLVKVEVNAPKLSSFGYFGDVSLGLSLEALAIEDIHFGIQSKTYEGQWHNKLIEFLGNFNHSKIMRLVSTNIAQLIIPKELRKTLDPPLYDIKRLTLFYGGRDSMLFDILDVLDSLIWIAPRLDTLCIIWRRSKKSIQFTYEISTDGEDNPKCGWSSLKKVKLENFENVEDQWKIKNYFFENGKMLESIEGLIECDI